MKDPSKTYCQATSNPSPSATSSPESASGPMPSDKPDGPTIEKSGPEVVPANLSARQAKEAGLLTSGTYGPRFITSSESVRLESSLVNRLRVKTASLGSALFRLTWKQRHTPLGVSISALRASAHRTSDKDCTSSEPTKPAPWITPQTHDTTVRGNVTADHHYSPHDLSNQALLASWPTPTGLAPAKNGNNEAGNSCNLVRMKALVQHGALGLTNGFWREAEWILCRDDKYRPIEPGSSPLAAGITDRVGKLRGYGNALTAPVAQGFIEAYLEVTQHA